MATNKKKVFVGSVFEFTQLGSDEVIRNLKDSYHDPENAPFVTFENTCQTFSAEVDSADDETLQEMLRGLSAYVDYNASRPPAFDDEPRMRPMQGTHMDDFIQDNKSSAADPLNFWSDDESDGQDALESLQHLTAFWAPRDGDIKILPPLYAQQITLLTGTSIFFEEAEKRCRLFQGDFRLALDKLLRLEPLLPQEIFKKQHPEQSLMANANLLVWPPNQKDARIEYVNMHQSHPSYRRVIVNKAEQSLFRKVIGELRPYNADTGTFERPGRFALDGVNATGTTHASKIWDGYVFESFGDAKNMEPVITSNPGSKATSEQTAMNQDSSGARIAAWTSKVVSGADPEIAPEAPIEPTQPITRRRVLVDSDDEDDEPPAGAAAASKPTKDDALEQATLVSLISSGSPSMSRNTGVNNSVAESDAEQDLIEDEDKSVLSSNTMLMADKFPILSAIPAPTQGRVNQNRPGLDEQLEFETESLAEERLAGSSAGLELDDEPAAAAPSTMSTTTGFPPLPESLLDDLASSVQGRPLSPAASSAQQLTTPTMSIPPSPRQTPATAHTSASPPSFRPAFDANAYGQTPKLTRGQGRGDRRRANASSGGNNTRGNAPRGVNRARGNASRGANNSRGGAARLDSSSRHEAGPVQLQTSLRRGAHQQGDNVRAFARAGRPAIGRGGRGGRGGPRQDDLIDVTLRPTDTSAPRIPPGFESHVPLTRRSDDWAHVDTPNIMDEPIDRMVDTMSSSELHTVATRASGRSGLRWSEEGADYRVTSIPTPNRTGMRQNSIAEAMAAIEAEARRKQAGQQPQQKQSSPNKKASEEKTPPVHHTMRQQGKNPGKKSGQQQETKAERQARLEKAKLDAYGPAPVKQAPKPKASPEPAQMSKWKRQQIAQEKNPALTEAHPEIMEDKARDEQTSKLIGFLQPVFEAGRAFSGRLSFEVSFGQVLVSPGPRFQDIRTYDVSGWNSLFDSKIGVLPSSTTFTKILTTNGADVDRILELKTNIGTGITTLWSRFPGPHSVSYEFSCQSRSNEDFLIIVDQSGKHELRKGLITVGMTNIYVPECIWDASATLSGHLNWPDPPKSLTNSASAFVDSLYIVPDKEKLRIVFRQPTDHEIKIRNLIVKRVSFHDSNLPGCEDVQLKVVEAKSLFFKHHPQDMNLWQGHEATTEDYAGVAREGRVHYELSLMHKKINHALLENETLEIGELTSEELTGKNLLKKPVIRSLLDVATHMVSKIDFIGMHNRGTLWQLEILEAQRHRDITATMGPAGQTILGRSTIMMPTASATARGHQPSARGSSLPGANSRVWQEPVHGIRTDTVAPIMVDPDGSKWRLGMGGARVPVVDDEPQFGNSTVMPDDSASQAGGLAMGMNGSRMPTTRLAAIKEQGFW
ncbi:hypothetical protein LTR72_000302 [Exophiala xenobiotica]|nr:hypothetical protein LTR72_000302 [Exophiala xenobiotica]KAK5299636.1 hypothetical protein LTR14_001850 [Exophiala xenobiotica]